MIPYSVREGLAGFRRARFSVVASTATMVVALVLIGMFIIVSYQAQSVSVWLRQRVGELELFLENADETMAMALHARAATYPGVLSARYVSPEEAERIFRQEFGEDAEVFFDERFLPASIKVQVESEYANADSLAVMATEFGTWNRVGEVIFNQPLLLKVQQNLRLLSMLGFALGILVICASTFLVANTIRLTIYARRLLIRTMKLVGATDSFVRRPFVVEGIAQGILAGLIAALVLAGLYTMLRNYIPQMSVISYWKGIFVGGTEIAIGVLLGWLGSHFAVRKFIRKVYLH